MSGSGDGGIPRGMLLSESSLPYSRLWLTASDETSGESTSFGMDYSAE